MPKKAETSDEKGRGSSCSLDVVKQFLQRDTIPEGYTKNDKRALRRRAKSFVLIGDHLYFTGGRSRHNKGLKESTTEGLENPEDEPDHTQVLRKVVFSEEEQQELITKAHIGEDGTHHGMERTTERVSNHYYWLGIVYGVRNTIHSCLYCCSRVKTSGRPFSASAGQNSAVTTSSSENPKHEVPKVLEGEMPNENADDFDTNLGEDGFSEFSAADSMSVKQETDGGPADTFIVNKDVCSHFWQKVEIQIFGPYQAGKRQIYVAVAMDSYSQFLEAVTMEVLSSVTLTHFVLNLFCRYGAMEKVLLLQNQVTRNKDIFINMQDLLQAGIAPLLLLPQVNLLDERWMHIEKSLSRFVGLYPSLWFQCLEVFMVPLRITLPPEAVYCPYYLVHGREPSVPDKLNQLYRADTSAHTEVQLTEEQEKQVVEMVTAAYGIDSDNPSINATLPQPSVPSPTHSPHVKEAKKIKTEEKQLHSTGDRKTSSAGKKRRGRPRLRERDSEIADEGEEVMEEEQTSNEVEHLSQGVFDAEIDIDSDNDKDATYKPDVKCIVKKETPTHATRSSGRQRKATYKAQTSDIFAKKTTKVNSKSMSVLASKEIDAPLDAESTQDVNQDQKELPQSRLQRNPSHFAMASTEDSSKSFVPKKMLRKRGRPCKTDSSDAEAAGFTEVKSGSRKKQLQVQQGIIKNMEQLSLDTFYFIVKQFLEHDAFPAGVSENTKDSIKELASLFHIQDRKLYSSVGKSAGRRIIMGEKMRFSLLRKAHARGEVHHGRASVLKYLSDLNVFWNGMSLDLDAFIHCCPECTVFNPLGSLPEVHIPSKSPSLSAGGRQHHLPHLSEDEEELNCEGVEQYLTGHSFPPSTTPQQQQQIQQWSGSFTVMQGCLYHQPHTAAQPRKVILSRDEQHSAIQQAHVEGGHHLSPEDTVAKLSVDHWWSGMRVDVLRQVVDCCMQDALTNPPVLHRNPLIQLRVTRIRHYYTQQIPKLDTSVLTAPEIDSRQTEGLKSTRKGHGDDAGGETGTGGRADPIVTQSVEKIIEDIGKFLTGDKASKAAENGEAKVAVQSSFGNLKSRKDAHKCQYCGKFISGNVAYRIHQYKHTGVKPFTCSTCGKSFTTSKSLQVHTRKHTGVKPYLCNQCGREFFRGTSFKYHLKTHNRTQHKPLPCSQCDRQFLTQNRLDKHIQYKHPAEPKVYMCEHCGKIFMHARSLKIHEQSHSSKHICQVCKKEFSDQDQLQSHIKAAHADHKMSTPDKSDMAKMEIEIAAPPESQQALSQQQQLLSHILYSTAPNSQLVQAIDLNMGHIQWREEQHQAAPPQHIVITEGPSGQITIEHAGNLLEQNPTGQITIEHAGNLLEQNPSGQITIGHAGNLLEQNTSGQITIEHAGNLLEQNPSGQITIEHAGNILDQNSSEQMSIEHAGNLLEQVTNAITVNEQAAAAPAISISSHPAQQITISGDQSAGGRIIVKGSSFDDMINNQGTGEVTLTNHPADKHISMGGEQASSQTKAHTLLRMEGYKPVSQTPIRHAAKTELVSAYHRHHTHTPPPFSHHQHTHHPTTTQILTQVQVPLPSSSSQALSITPAPASVQATIQSIQPAIQLVQSVPSSVQAALQSGQPAEQSVQPTVQSVQQSVQAAPASAQVAPAPVLQSPVSSSASVGHTQLQPVSAAQLQSLHTLQSVGAAETVLLQQHEAVPMQYEEECEPSLSEADLSAVHLLAQASLTSHQQHMTPHRQSEQF